MTPIPASPPLRVLALTLSFGAGHGRAAAAVARALSDVPGGPEVDVRLIDALAGSRLLFRLFYVWPYWAMLRYAPGLWNRLFAARLRHRSQHTAPMWAFRFGCPRVFETIARFNPDVILAAEVGACEIAVIARRRGLTEAPIVNVITDHQAEPAWVKPEVRAYAVADRSVGEQLCAWGAPADRVFVSGIPTDASFQQPADNELTRARYGATGGRPMVLLMGGGMGPTRMDQIAAGLCASGRPMHIVAVAGHDARVRRRLDRVRRSGETTLKVCGWVDDIPALMRSAAVLVTKPGGLTISEAAICGVPAILFDPIPGPEERNAERVVKAGAARLARGADQTVRAALSVLGSPEDRDTMSGRARALASPTAAGTIADLVLTAGRDAAHGPQGPVLILTIGNGAGHTRVADAIAQRLTDRQMGVTVVDVADYMTVWARLTHLTIYLWLVRHAPRLWEWIDRFQKRQTHTSPEWYYRSGCGRLFDLVRSLRPSAMIATEVGCCEILALVKRDLGLACPLIAVNGEYDADRAWVQPEVDLYSVPHAPVADELCAHGAEPSRVRAWGVPIAAEFREPVDHEAARRRICARFDLSPDRPLVLVAGGSEGLGRPAAIAARLLGLPGLETQVIVLAGRNEGLRRRCVALATGPMSARLRVLGWTPGMRDLMVAADLLVSKLGHTFDEAIACRLPIVAPDPPPGSERVQHRLLEAWGLGRAVGSLDEMAAVVADLLAGRESCQAMRRAAAARAGEDAAGSIAGWLIETVAVHHSAAASRVRPRPAASSRPRFVAGEGSA